MSVDRLYFMDYLRTTSILLVLVIHSILAYASITYVDPQNYVFSFWPIVEKNIQTSFNTFWVVVIDSFNMSLLFVIAGFFSKITVDRLGARSFIINRVLRLGFPFLLMVTCYVPLGSYIGYLQSGQKSDYFSFWLNDYFQNHWHSGTSWFLWLLLALSGLYALLVPLKLKILKPFEVGESWYNKVLIVSFFAYIIMMVAPHFFTQIFGPFWLQPNRLLLYVWLFLLGIRLGESWEYEPEFFSSKAKWVHLWWVWIGASIIIYALIFYIILYELDLNQQSIELMKNLRSIPNKEQLTHLGYFIVYSLAFPIVCVLMIYGLLAVYLKYMNFYSRAFEYLSQHAYGISLIHFPITVWLQHLLIEYHFTASIKITLVFTLTFLLSFTLSILIRKIPGVKSII